MDDRQGGPAIDSPGVRASLAAARRRAWLVLAGGLVLFVAFVAAASIVEGRADELERSGERVDGIVVSYSPGTRLVSERVDVQFTFDGVVRHERVHLDDSSPRYAEGQHVVVVVDADDPSHYTLTGETNQSDWTVWPMILALLAGAGGLIAGPSTLVRVRRQRRLLSSQPWRPINARYLEIRSGNSVRGLLRVTEDGVAHVLTLVSYARWNLRRLGLREFQNLEIVGELPGYVVVHATNCDRVVSARPPYSARTERRWLRRFGSEA